MAKILQCSFLADKVKKLTGVQKLHTKLCNMKFILLIFLGGRGRRQFSNRGRGGRKRRHQNMRRNEKNDVTEKININHYSQAQDNPPDFQFCKTDKTWGDCWRGDLPQFPGTGKLFYIFI